MKNKTACVAAALLCAAFSPAVAADEARVEALEQQLKDVQRQLADLKRPAPSDTGAIAGLKRDNAEHYAAIISGLPRITSMTLAFWLTEMVFQVS